MKTSIFRNLSWIVICTIVAKLLGGLYRIVLTRILGTNIGLYQLVFSVYSFLVVLISSGIPLAVSRLISSSNNIEKRQKIIYGITSILFTVSIILCLILVLGSKSIALLQGEKKIYICYIILAPSLIFGSASAILKGYYQGVHKFNISAISSIFEQVIRVVGGLVLMIVLSKFYILGALIGSMIGTLLGDVASFVFLKFSLKKQIDFKYSFKNIEQGKKVFYNAYPIMLYSLIVPFTTFIDSFLVVRLLGINYVKSTAILLYGLQNGVVGSIISIPSIFSFSLASVLMPNLSKDLSNNDEDRFNSKVRLTLKLTMCIVTPFALFFIINSGNIINLLYGRGINGCGVNGQVVAKYLLILSSLNVVFNAINQVCAVILQNLNKKGLPILNLGVGMVCKLIIELVFIPSKRLGIFAYAIAISAGAIVSGVLNLYSVESYCYDIFDIQYLSKQFVLLAVVFGLLTLFKLFASTWVFILGSIFTIIIYFIGVYVIKLFSRKDVNLFIK